MKTIGIKLADGTFYPVLEEGTPKKRMLDLTTAKDNQTKVQIDLYRSETGSMDDAEYVDTLEVTKLNPHPNGEPELHLSVGLDENNNLSAEVMDPETGKKSETEVKLVSRTEEERANPADFAITDPDVVSEQIVDANSGLADATEATTITPDDMPEINSNALEDMPFSFDHVEPNAAGTGQRAKNAQEDFEGSLPDYSSLDEDLPIEDTTLESVNFANDAPEKGSSDETLVQEPKAEETEAPASAEDFSTSNFSLPEIGEDFLSDSDSDETLADTSVSASDDVTEEDPLPGFGDADETPAADSEEEQAPDTGFSLPDIDENFGAAAFADESNGLTAPATDDDTTLADFGTESVSDSESSLPDINDDFGSIADSDSTQPDTDTTLPDIDTTHIDTTHIDSSNLDADLPDFGDTSSDTTLPDFGDTSPAFDNSDKLTESPEPEPESFELPDFDAPVTTSNPFDDDSTSTASGISFDDFDDPAFSSTNLDSTGTSAMDFSDLYDKETLAGEHASLYDDEEENKKTRAPVVICIICAIICVIATILLLFVVPSKYNLLSSRNTKGVSMLDRFFKKDTVVEKTVEEPKPLPNPEETTYIDVKPEASESGEAPEAVEDKIVIAPEPEKVVPKPAPAAEEKELPSYKPTNDVKYRIKWGDTLWDISESYYKTPWKYPKIATYNKIKNPDLIISGSDILIPAE